MGQKAQSVGQKAQKVGQESRFCFPYSKNYKKTWRLTRARSRMKQVFFQIFIKELKTP